MDRDATANLPSLECLTAMDARTLRLTMAGATPAIATRAATLAIRRRIWTSDPVAFSNAAYRVLTLGDTERTEFLDELYALGDDEQPDDATRLLRTVFLFFNEHPALAVERERWERWFTAWAGPNQAESVAEHFTYAWHAWIDGRLDPAREAGLARWMVENGISTLLDAHWGAAIRALLVCADVAGDTKREAVVVAMLRSRALDAALQEDVAPSKWLWPILDRAMSSPSADDAVCHALQNSARARSSLRARSVAYALLGRDDTEAAHLADFPRLRLVVERWACAMGGAGPALLVTFADELHILPIAQDERAPYLEALDEALGVAFADFARVVARPDVMDAVLLLAQAHATTHLVRRHVASLDSRTLRQLGRDAEVVGAVTVQSPS